MTNTNLLQAMGRIDPKLIADGAPDAEQKKKTRVKWASLAACFCFAVMTAVIGGRSSNISSSVVIVYGPFIFVPVLIASFIPLCVSLVRKETTLPSSFIASSMSLVIVNILNILGVYLYSRFGGINIWGDLPIILISSNVGMIISIAANMLLDRKIKAWWIKLLLWFFISVVSIIVSAFAHNIILMLLQGNSVTAAM